MYKLAFTAGLALLLTTGLAWAETDLYDDEQDVISKDARAKRVETTEEVTITAAGSHAAFFADGLEGLALDSAFLGSYFGAGDEFTFGERSATSREDARRFSHDGSAPVYGGHDGEYSVENVYGPLWGVPPDAVGLEGFDPWEYFLLMGIDPEQVSEAHGAHQHTAADGADPAAEPRPAEREERAAKPRGISCDNND